MFQNIDYFNIGDPNIVSDHCLMSVSYVFDHESTNSANVLEELSLSDDAVNVDYRCKWKPELKDEYICNLNSDECLTLLNNLSDRICFEHFA